MNVLVTGGAGFIGSHACLGLAEAGYTPVVYDNLSTGSEQAVQWGPFVKADLRDTETLRKVLMSYEIDAVMHFAASAYVGESVANPQKYYMNNTVATLNLLNVMLERNIHTLVFSSTCATYGAPNVLPITEETPQLPINPYGRSKLFAEQMIKDYSVSYDLQFASLRYFNVVGSDPEGRIGEAHHPETHLVPLAVGAALGVYPPIEVFGCDYDTLDGTAVRDYIHVLDLVEAHIKALTWLLEHPGENLPLNLGSGRGVSVLELIQTVESVLGKGVPYKRASQRPGDPPKLIASSARAETYLNWKPRYSLRESISHTAAWLKKSLPLLSKVQ